MTICAFAFHISKYDTSSYNNMQYCNNSNKPNNENNNISYSYKSHMLIDVHDFVYVCVFE